VVSAGGVKDKPIVPQFLLRVDKELDEKAQQRLYEDFGCATSAYGDYTIGGQRGLACGTLSYTFLCGSFAS